MAQRSTTGRITGRRQRTGDSDFDACVQLAVSDLADLTQSYGENLAGGGMFILDPAPPQVGAKVLIAFVDPEGTPLSRVRARVVHARPAANDADETAGMGLELGDLDEAAEVAAAEFRNRSGRPRTESLSTPHRASMIESLARTEKESTAQGPVIGIDLGTTYSCVAFVQNGEPKVLQTDQGYETIPSIVLIDSNKKVRVGHSAREGMVHQPDRAIYGSKRFIGRPFASREVHTHGHFFEYELASGRGGLTAARIGDLLIPLDYAAAIILSYLRKQAQKALGTEVNRAVITVPAYFGENQRQAVRRAGKQAGLHVERILNEPTAAAVALGYGRNLDATVLVYDLGGGTFDTTLLRIRGDHMEVLATDGDPFLGGCDFDDRLTEYILMSVEREHGHSLRDDPVAVQRVRTAAEGAKRELSTGPRATVEVPFAAQLEGGPLDVRLEIEADIYRALTDDIVERTLGFVQQVLDRAKVRGADIDDVILVGGQSRDPRVRQLLRDRFALEPSRKVHPDHAVALGAALVAHAAHGDGAGVEGGGLELTDVLPASILLGLPNGETRVLIEGGTRLPASTSFEITIDRSDASNVEYRVPLYRGQEGPAEYCEPLGEVRLAGSFALAVSKTRAPVTIEIDAEGIMVVTAVHPITQTPQRLTLTLKGAEDQVDGEVHELGEADGVGL